jgi:hypothetical protein
VRRTITVVPAPVPTPNPTPTLLPSARGADAVLAEQPR